ncbi:hypothetical protein ABI59_06080 [Acidobacteria bacterium Mor1]|nr:hypothetical protein ABI59_06080 [Acidobacteria bacterium Mor1]
MISRLFSLVFAAAAMWFVGRLLRSAQGAGQRGGQAPGGAQAPGQAPPRGAGSRASGRRLEGPMVRDKICNTFLAKESALIVQEGDREHYFCSEGCRKTFLEGARGGVS